MASNDPFGEMDRLFDQIRRNMMQAWNEPIGSRDQRDVRSAFEAERPAAADREMERPTGDHGAVNRRFERRDDELVALGDLPGFEREEIDVQFDDTVLSIEAVHEVDDDDHYRTRRVSERTRIADEVAVDGATATYRNGVLELRFPLAGTDDDATSIDIE